MNLSSVGVVLLAATFLGAALSKQRAPTQFRSILRDLVPDAWVRPVALAVPAIEASLAVLLLSGIAGQAAAVIALVVLTLFCAALARMWMVGITQDCGCFGEASQARTPASGLLRNAGLMAFAVAGVIAPSSADVWRSDVQQVVVHSVVVVGIVVLWALLRDLVARHELLLTSELAP